MKDDPPNLRPFDPILAHLGEAMSTRPWADDELIDPKELAKLPPLIHGFRADSAHWPALWNFSLQGTRDSVEMTCHYQRVGEMISACGEGRAPDPETPGTQSVRDVPLDQLSEFSAAGFSGFVSGFGITQMMGSLVRYGGDFGFGAPPHPTRWASDAQKQAVLDAANRELLLERVRRDVAAATASRLTCLWTAPDTTPMRNWVVQRVLRTSESFLVSVVVTAALRVTRCDATWIDHVADEGESAATAYWQGVARGDEPRWEYLIDGRIACLDADDLQRMRALARHPPADILGSTASHE